MEPRIDTKEPPFEVDLLHDIGRRAASAVPLHQVLSRVVDFAVALVRCDSCFVYVLDNDHLVLRASKNQHDDAIGRIKMRMGEGITGWVAEQGKVVAISEHAAEHPRFQYFNELPEDTYEAFLSVPLLSRGKVVGVINLQHRKPHVHTAREIRMISTVGFLVGAEIELARLEFENSHLSMQLETQGLVERAKRMLERESCMSETDAYLAMQRHGRRERMSLKDVAAAVLGSAELRKSLAD